MKSKITHTQVRCLFLLLQEIIHNFSFWAHFVVSSLSSHSWDWLLPYSLLCHLSRGSWTKEVTLSCHELKQLGRKHLISLCIAVDGWILVKVCLNKYCESGVCYQPMQSVKIWRSFELHLVMVKLDRSVSWIDSWLLKRWKKLGSSWLPHISFW